MSHPNATLTPGTRLRSARLIVEHGWTHTDAAKMFMVATRTARTWAERYRTEGAAGMTDRSSRPHHSPTRAPAQLVRAIVRLRWAAPVGGTGWARSRSPAGSGSRPRRCTRCWCAAGSTACPGSTGSPANRCAATNTTIPVRCSMSMSPSSATSPTAVAWFADLGVTVERELSGNGAAYRSHTWREVCAERGVTPKRTRPYRPRTNGKIERFHRTLADGWAYARFYPSESRRRAALPGWLHFCNHHRPHSATGGKPPITRLTNLPGHHTQSSISGHGRPKEWRTESVDDSAPVDGSVAFLRSLRYHRPRTAPTGPQAPSRSRSPSRRTPPPATAAARSKTAS